MNLIRRIATIESLGTWIITAGALFGAVTGLAAAVYILDSFENPRFDHEVEELHRDVRVCEITEGCNVTAAEERADRAARQIERENERDLVRAARAGWATSGNAALVLAGILLIRCRGSKRDGGRP